jgi:hypothetical protein
VSNVIVSNPGHIDLVVYRGDSGRFKVTVKQSDGTPLDISAATWLCDVKSSPDADKAYTSFEVLPVAGDTSSVEVVISPDASTAIKVPAYWDLQMQAGTEVTTLLSGRVRLTRDVSW